MHNRAGQWKDYMESANARKMKRDAAALEMSFQNEDHHGRQHHNPPGSDYDRTRRRNAFSTLPGFQTKHEMKSVRFKLKLLHLCRLGLLFFASHDGVDVLVRVHGMVLGRLWIWNSNLRESTVDWCERSPLRPTSSKRTITLSTKLLSPSTNVA